MFPKEGGKSPSFPRVSVSNSLFPLQNPSSSNTIEAPSLDRDKEITRKILPHVCTLRECLQTVGGDSVVRPLDGLQLPLLISTPRRPPPARLSQRKCEKLIGFFSEVSRSDSGELQELPGKSKKRSLSGDIPLLQIQHRSLAHRNKKMIRKSMLQTLIMNCT